MRIVVLGATGNVGTSLLDALRGDERVDFILGVARRLPARTDDARPVQAAPGQRGRLGTGIPCRRRRRRALACLRLVGRFVPDVEGLRFQAVHSYDVGNAYRLAALGDVRGAFNVAAEPVIDPDALACLLHARKLPLPPGVLRGAAAATWKLRLQPSPPGWVDLALQTPLLDTARARHELGWEPRFSGLDALSDAIAGIREGSGAATPPLDPSKTRAEELATRVGGDE